MKATLLTLLLGVLASFCQAAPEIPLLERTITIRLQNERLESALKKIAAQGGFTFSYNPTFINAEKVITENFAGKTVREVLDVLFGGTIQYKQRGQYIILTRATASMQKERVLGGYITDEQTGERLKNVSIYDPVSLSSAVTDDYGYFEITLDDPLANVTLVVNKQNYADTVLMVPRDDLGLLKIPIKVTREKITTMADSLGHKIRRLWRKSWGSIQDINMLNITDTLYRKFQFSVIPFIGTNHKLSGNVINDYSINLLGGYSLGNRKFEFGGLFNATRGNVSGFQAAGLFNAVAGGAVNGIQMAGLINATRLDTKALQFAGLINFNWANNQSIALAGLINYNHRETRGVKFSGLINATLGEQHGVHAAGLLNFTMKNVDGAQIAGLTNVTADTVRGAQVAGAINVGTQYVRGLQLAGLVNYARRLNGVQIGLINVADSVRGVQFGLLSFALKGYHTIEVSADEIFYTNVSFRTGTRNFYNIFTAGAKPDTFEQEETMWSFGYGIGTMPRLNRWLSLNVDLTSSQIVKGDIDAVNLLNKLYVGFDFKVAKKMSFTAGATLNAHVTDATYEFYPELFSDYKPSIWHTSNDGDTQWRWWLGAKIGVRFL